MLERGLLDGFRHGWRKSYVELLDAGAAGLLVAIAEAGGAVPLTSIEHAAWEQVAAAYGYEPEDDTERSHMARLLGAMVDQFTDIGVIDRHDDEVVLTGLGSALACIVAFTTTDDDGGGEDLYLVDTDAQSLLLVCVEEAEPGFARAQLVAWCDARRADQAAAELCEAMLDDDDPTSGTSASRRWT